MKTKKVGQVTQAWRFTLKKKITSFDKNAKITTILAKALVILHEWSERSEFHEVKKVEISYGW